MERIIPAGFRGNGYESSDQDGRSTESRSVQSRSAAEASGLPVRAPSGAALRPRRGDPASGAQASGPRDLTCVIGFLDAQKQRQVWQLSRNSQGRLMAGEGLLGMSWGWFVAGVPSLTVSQWNVSDESTAKLMTVFYDRLLGGATKAEALRQAQLTLLKDRITRHPFFWAPFVLVGDYRE